MKSLLLAKLNERLAHSSAMCCVQAYLPVKLLLLLYLQKWQTMKNSTSNSIKICTCFTQDITRICAEYKESCAPAGFVAGAVPHPSISLLSTQMCSCPLCTPHPTSPDQAVQAAKKWQKSCEKCQQGALWTKSSQFNCGLLQHKLIWCLSSECFSYMFV